MIATYSPCRIVMHAPRSASTSSDPLRYVLPVRRDNRLITGAQLADLGVVDVGVDNVSSCADYHDLGVGR